MPTKEPGRKPALKLLLAVVVVVLAIAAPAAAMNDGTDGGWPGCNEWTLGVHYETAPWYSGTLVRWCYQDENGAYQDPAIDYWP